MAGSFTCFPRISSIVFGAVTVALKSCCQTDVISVFFSLGVYSAISYCPQQFNVYFQYSLLVLFVNSRSWSWPAQIADWNIRLPWLLNLLFHFTFLDVTWSDAGFKIVQNTKRSMERITLVNGSAGIETHEWENGTHVAHVPLTCEFFWNLSLFSIAVPVKQGRCQKKCMKKIIQFVTLTVNLSGSAWTELFLKERPRLQLGLSYVSVVVYLNRKNFRNAKF